MTALINYRTSVEAKAYGNENSVTVISEFWKPTKSSSCCKYFLKFDLKFQQMQTKLYKIKGVLHNWTNKITMLFKNSKIAFQKYI